MASQERKVKPEFRRRLVAILGRLDQLTAEADAILSEPVFADLGAMAEELRELLNDMRAKVEEKCEHRRDA
jgi:hypothetical protein